MTVEEIQEEYCKWCDRNEFIEGDWNHYAKYLEQQLIELKKPFAVQVIIPELEEGCCNKDCPFHFHGWEVSICAKGWGKSILAEDLLFIPGPGCPRFEG